MQHVSEIQRQRALANEYPHHLARKGYAGLEAELLMEGIPLEELTLALLWVKARQGKDGSFKNPKVVKVNEKIVSALLTMLLPSRVINFSLCFTYVYCLHISKS